LVRRLRHTVLPEFAGRATVDVGGVTATFIDFGEHVGRRLPVVIGAVLLVSLVVLLALFRAVVVAAKAALMNLLSIAAAYGVVVAVFQWGWGRTLVGVERPGPVEAWVPLMLFTILFGLSMDYEVLLLSRVREFHDRGLDNRTAVETGLSSTGRVIVAAAAVMVVVFGAFVLSDLRVLKIFGLGMAVAILIDATIVRLMLLPATMELLGEANWWAPRWLVARLPSFEPHDRAGTPLDESSTLAAAALSGSVTRREGSS
jgi:putative drug exporter of the RND superfamily